MDWPSIYGQVVSATGWTFDYVRWDLEWPDLILLLAYWSENPPVSETLYAIAKGFFGMKQKDGKVNKESLAELGSIAGIKVTRKPKHAR